MPVDVVVVNYRTPLLLADFIESYRENSFRGCTLTVVDVDPLPVDAFYDHPAVDTVVELDTNVGYGAACNHGAQFGMNEVILLANADTLLSDKLLECYDVLRHIPEWGVLGPRQVDQQNRLTAAGVFGDPQHPQMRGWHERDTGRYSDIRDDALTVSGALYFIKRAVWDELTRCPIYQKESGGACGAFLETPHYFEETACSYHARAHGYKCVYYGAARMIHLWHQASEIGGWAEKQFLTSQSLFRKFCAAHDILCE